MKRPLAAAALCLSVAGVGWIALGRHEPTAPAEPVPRSHEAPAPASPAIAARAPNPTAQASSIPVVVNNALGDPIVDETSATPAERQLLAELGGEPRVRALGHLIFAGYHHDRAGDAEKALEWRQFEDMKAHPKESLTAIRRALRAPSLDKPDTAYGRVSLLALAAQLPGQKEETRKLLRSEMTERIVPSPPVLPPPQSREEARARLDARPEVAPPTAAHDLYLKSADPADALDATLRAIAAQTDVAVRRKIQAQYTALYPDQGERLAREAAARGTPLPAAPERPSVPTPPSSPEPDEAVAE